MGIQANEVHERIVKAERALTGQPALAAFMKAELRERVHRQATFVAPLLVEVVSARESDDAALTQAELTLAATRHLIVWIHEGARFRYRNHASQLTNIAPLRLGNDAEENRLRLITLERELPRLRPAFPWIPDEGLSLVALQKQAKAHTAAMTVEDAVGVRARDALTKLREARGESNGIWDDDGGLADWVRALVPKDQQYAFGLERRKAPRSDAPAAPPGPPLTATDAAPESAGPATAKAG